MGKTWLKKWQLFLVAALVSLAVQAKDALPDIPFGRLPPEAQQTIVLIQRGGPFPYAKDGATFGNYEGSLPRRQRGYYREYTVKSPGARNRGARRIIAGGMPPAEYYYTADHYATFGRIRE